MARPCRTTPAGLATHPVGRSSLRTGFLRPEGNDLEIKEARRQYHRWLLTRNLSTHTTRAYDNDIGCFERHVGPATQVARIDRECLISFLELQRQSGLSPASLRRRASALRGFSQWMLSEG